VPRWAAADAPCLGRAPPRHPQHNVRLQLTYLDVEKGEQSKAAAKTAAMVQKALQAVPQRTPERANSAPAAA
jgi:hypothetical protein